MIGIEEGVVVVVVMVKGEPGVREFKSVGLFEKGSSLCS